jgi:fructose-bisphosphate aldolase class 1
MRHGKIQAKIFRSTTQQAKIKGVEFFSGGSEKETTVRHLSIVNFHCTLCCDLTDLSAELLE